MSLYFDKPFLDDLLAQAKENPRLRTSYDLRNSPEDESQRMLNALIPGTEVAIHRHPNSTEDVFCLSGCIEEIFYDDQGNEIDCIILCPHDGRMGCTVPKGVWHTVFVYEPSVIYEVKAGQYGKDGSELLSSISDK